MPNAKKSRRGVYYDLSLSPYEYISPYGDIFKFSSNKKLEMYTRDIQKDIDRLHNIINRNQMQSFLSNDTIDDLMCAVYKALYRKIEG